MGDKTKIEWTDASWTPIRARVWQTLDEVSGKERVGWHCERVSEGCRNCYAEGMNLRLGTGLEFKPGNLFRPERQGHANGEARVFLDEEMLMQPLRWRRPRKIFVNSMTDTGAHFVTAEMLDRIFAVAALCPQHTFQILTKRPERMRQYLAQCGASLGRQTEIRQAIVEVAGGRDAPGVARALTRVSGSIDSGTWQPLPNVWLGTSVEDQPAADTRLPDLLATPAYIRFVSGEPLLGLVNLRAIALPPQIRFQGMATMDALAAAGKFGKDGKLLHWVIAGGESGRRARPVHPDWIRALRDQCADTGTAFHFKQWGEWWEAGSELREDDGGHLQVEVGSAMAEEMFDPRSDCLIAPDGRVFRDPSALPPDTPCRHMVRLGKKVAGRTLDGVEHDGFPA